MLIPFLAYLTSTLIMIFIGYFIGAESANIKLSNLMLKMLDEDMEYTGSDKSSLTIEERRANLQHFAGKEAVYGKIIEEFNMAVIPQNRK